MGVFGPPLRAEISMLLALYFCIMELPIQIAFKNLESSDAIINKVKMRAQWLERYCHRIISCRVMIEVPHKHHQSGNLYNIRIILRVPGEELVISRNPPLHAPRKTLRIAIHEAFDEARRILSDYVRRRRVEIKQHTTPPHAYVIHISDGEGGYGFIRSEDGRELYFHRNSVLHSQFDRLDVGTEVRFTEEKGENGPQVSTLEIVGKQGRHFQLVS